MGGIGKRKIFVLMNLNMRASGGGFGLILKLRELKAY